MAELDIKETLDFINNIETEEMELNIGSQYPGNHGFLRVKLKINGEIIRMAEPIIGYTHRCVEKIGEMVTFGGFIPYTDRKDYIAAMNENFGYCLAVEKILQCEIPERASYLRIIVAELNRIASHLLATGIYAINTGAITPMFHCFRERERIIDLFEEICGARLTYNYVRIGGVAFDTPKGWLDRVSLFLDYFKPKIKEYNQLLSDNMIFINRTANIGILAPDIAINHGCSGPMLRGSGIKWDLRRDDPYSIYDQFEFDIPVGMGEKGTVGDCWDRYIVRIWEIEQSIRILRQALDSIPDGPIKTKLPQTFKIPKGEAYTRTESPRGEMGYYIISDGSENAYRLRCRSPAFCNLCVLPTISSGAMIADMMAILSSVDIVLCDIDR